MKKTYVLVSLLLLLCMLFSACSQEKYEKYEGRIKDWVEGKYYEIDNTNNQNPKKGSLSFEISEVSINTKGMNGDMVKYIWGVQNSTVVGSTVIFTTYNIVSCSDEEFAFKTTMKVDDTSEDTECKIIKSDGKFYYVVGEEAKKEVIKE